MAKSMVEMAAVVDGERRLVEVTYKKAKSKHPMVFVMLLLLQELITKIQYSETPSDCLDLACKAAATLMQAVMALLREAVKETQRIQQEYEVKLDEAQDRLLTKEAAISAQQHVQQETTTEDATTLPQTSGRH
jgi:hypothetical protein